MPPIKKQVSPDPTPRAAALSQSASRFSAGVTSAWQNIAGNSPRLAAAHYRGPGTTRAAERTTKAVEPETIRQVGWREEDRAVGMRTKRKYSLFGIGFGPKVPVFETEKVKLPVYQETNRDKRYYAAVKTEDVARIKREGFQAEAGSKGATPKTIEQYNSRGHLYFFNSEAGACDYGKSTLDGKYAVVEFVMPEYQKFTSHPEARVASAKPSKEHARFAVQSIPAECIKGTTSHKRMRVE